MTSGRKRILRGYRPTLDSSSFICRERILLKSRETFFLCRIPRTHSGQNHIQMKINPTRSRFIRCIALSITRNMFCRDSVTVWSCQSNELNKTCFVPFHLRRFLSADLLHSVASHFAIDESIPIINFFVFRCILLIYSWIFRNIANVRCSASENDAR